MKNQLNIPGFLPPDKQDNVKFLLFKGLPYSIRMILYLILIAAGFIFQIFMLKVWPGAAFLIIAALLNLTRGFSNKVKLDSYVADNDWTQVDIEKLREVDEFNSKLAKWDKDALDISNGTGFLTFILAAVGVAAISVFLQRLSGSSIIIGIFIVDAIILFLPIWFSGLRKIQKQDVLCIKTEIVRELEEFFQTIREDGENFKPALMLVRDKSGKSVPTDCRFTISFDKMPSGFYGIQAQININMVQNVNYPYFYCVIAAEKSFGLDRYVNAVPVPKSIIVNYEEDSDAGVIVIRQRTTKNSGFNTRINCCKSIFERALKISRIILEDCGRS